MFVQDNPRKYSMEEYIDMEENQLHSTMFPRTINFSQADTLQLLKLKFNKQHHHQYMLNYLSHCHNTRLVEFFIKFKTVNSIELQNPRISTYYSNDCFVNLYEIGQYLQGKNITYPSIHIGKASKDLRKLLDKIFLEEGYIPNFQRFLLFYPQYLEKHVCLLETLFQDSIIDNKIAYFFGIIACAQQSSIYGLNRMIRKFIKVGGNINWVTTGSYPDKIRKLLPLNRILAKSIWELDSDLIEQIIQNNLWTKNQLALIVQILTFSNQFATISLAIGLNCEEIDNSILDLQTLLAIKEQYDSLNYQSNEGIRLATVIENISRFSSDEENDKPQANEKKKQKNDKQEKQKKIVGNKSARKSARRIDNQQLIQSYMKQIGCELKKQELNSKMCKALKPLLPNYEIVEKRTDKDFPLRDSSDANFKYTAFPLLYNLTNMAAEQTLDLISYSQIMTSSNFGQQKINDTKSFRKAIRYYCENLNGHFHFEYNYKNISKLLTMPLKFYIRLLTLSPVHINKQVLKEIKHEEGQINVFDLGHVAILVANCKMGLSLTYAMHSFEDC